MQFLSSFGIDLRLLLAQIINFGLLLFILNRWVYRPLIKKIEEREAQLKEAQQLQQEVAQAKQTLQTQKSAADLETRSTADKIIKEAEQIAEDIKQKARLEAETEKAAIIKQIKSRLSELDYDKQPK